MWISQLVQCVLIHSVKKAVIHRKKQIVLCYLKMFFLKNKRCFLLHCTDIVYLIIFSMLS